MQVKVSNRTLLFIMERASVHSMIAIWLGCYCKNEKKILSDTNFSWFYTLHKRSRFGENFTFELLYPICQFFKMCIYLVCRRISTGNDCKISQTQYEVTPHLHTEHKFMRHSSKQPKLFPVPMLLTSMFLVGIWYFHYHITPNGSDVAMWSCTLYFQQFWLKKPALSTACKQVFYHC